MPTTTIRLDDDREDRISAAADLAGKTSHAFIVDAVARAVEQVEAQEELHRIAEKRWAAYSSASDHSIRPHGRHVRCS